MQTNRSRTAAFAAGAVLIAAGLLLLAGQLLRGLAHPGEILSYFCTATILIANFATFFEMLISRFGKAVFPALLISAGALLVLSYSGRFARRKTHRLI